MPKNLLIADDADLIAIYNYMQDQRKFIPQFPKLQPLIDDFFRWYQGLGWWDLHGNMTGTFAEAARRRDEVNKLRNDVFRPDQIPADMRNRPPGAASGLAAPAPPKEPWIPVKYKIAAAAGVAAVAALALLKKFSVLRFL